MKNLFLHIILVFILTSCNDKSVSEVESQTETIDTIETVNIAKTAEEKTVDLERNDENDVLDRFYKQNKNCIQDYEKDETTTKDIKQYQLQKHTLEVHTFQWNQDYKNCQMASRNYIFVVKNRSNEAISKFYLPGHYEDDVTIEEKESMVEISYYGSAVGFEQLIFLFYENDDLQIYRTNRIAEYEKVVDNHFDFKSKTYQIIKEMKTIKKQKLTKYPPSQF